MKESIRELHERAGARFGDVAGLSLPRNYGDPAAEYEALRSGAGVVQRADRAPVRMWGRDPVKMIDALVTNAIADAPEHQGRYAAMLTPKGKMIAEFRVFRRPDGDVLIEPDRRTLDGALAHMEKFVPPLFARFEDASDAVGALGVYGPEAQAAVSGALGGAPDEDSPEDAFVVPPLDEGEALVARTLYTGDDGYDVFAPLDALPALWHALVDAGARPAGHGALEVVRIEAGRPRWGAELDESTIPLEAHLKERAISEAKGCYTGQEVIVRILHRGRVNWHLRGFLLGDRPVPAPDTPLLHREHGKRSVGRITSACSSPRHGQTIALGYARRELDLPATLRLADLDGPEVVVVELPFAAPEAARAAD